MEIESTTFGTITIARKTYEHDVVIRLSGDVVKRKKKLSKKYYGEGTRALDVAAVGVQGVEHHLLYPLQ